LFWLEEKHAEMQKFKILKRFSKKGNTVNQ